MNTLPELQRRIEAAGQSQVFRFWNKLDADGRAKLLGQLQEIDWEQIPALVAAGVVQRPDNVIPADLEPAAFFPRQPADPAQQERYSQAVKRGEELFRSGRVAALTVAGGQGTRLGFDGPKGTYPIGPASGRSLFQYFAETLLYAERKYGRRINWYIMTSQLNHRATVDFFASHNFFGLTEEQLFFFSQGMMPAFGTDGRILLDAKDSLALAPNGHGGTLLALRRSGALDKMARDGNDVISYFQVDNPLAPVVCPLFAGLHDLEGSELSAISLTKTGPFEKLGNFCLSGGRVHIIEYSDLPAELAESRDADGQLRFRAGSPAIHIFSRAFIERLTADGRLQLPWHRADKKVPYLNEAGERVEPAEPNAVKLESFIFDALPLAARTMILEGDRDEMFAPTKNKTGVDSVESCRQSILARDARRLAAAGITLPPGVAVELSPLAGDTAGELAAYLAEHPVVTAW